MTVKFSMNIMRKICRNEDIVMINSGIWSLHSSHKLRKIDCGFRIVLESLKLNDL